MKFITHAIGDMDETVWQLEMNFINENHHVNENVMHDEKGHMDDIQQDG
jgi:hypothetical protein